MTPAKAHSIVELKEELLSFKKTPLYSYRKKNGYVPVLGDGSPDAHIVFVGEAPGKREALTGKPFAGAAGKMLDSLLTTIHLSRDDIYITNLVNDRPPENRDPNPKEIKIYSKFLLQLLSIIRPNVIVTLGRFSLSYFMETYGEKNSKATIAQLHGKRIQLHLPYGDVTLIPLYHPAFALYNGSKRIILEKDFQILTKFR